VATPTEKDVETMPTQKVFKQRVRARMTKTGESYTAARRQLLRKATEPGATEPGLPESKATGMEAPAPVSPLPSPVEPASGSLLVADESMRRATGKGHQEWFALLDAWGATEHNHTEIARWLAESHGVPGWWTQNVTVAYERARGMRAPHQMRDGFGVSVTRTVAVDAQTALAAFTDESVRERWFPAAPLRRRPTRAALAARFDWSDPPSRVIVSVVPRSDGKAVVAVGHEQLPDAEAGERLKLAWRAWLDDLKTMLERERQETRR